MKKTMEWEAIFTEIAPRIENGEEVEVSLRLVNQCFSSSKEEVENLRRATGSGAVEVACEHYLNWSSIPRPLLPNHEPFCDILQARIRRLPIADKMRLFDDLINHADIVVIFKQCSLEQSQVDRSCS
jgi:hypothetical protein